MPEDRPLEADKPERAHYTGDPDYPLNTELQNVLFALAEYGWKLQSMRTWLDEGVEWRTETNPEGENFRQAKVEGDIEEFHTIVGNFQHFVDGELD